jgi:hypothetical protein
MCDIEIKQCKYVYQRAGRKNKRCTRVCQTAYCGNYCSSHYWQLNRFSKNKVYTKETNENTPIPTEKKVPLFDVEIFNFSKKEWFRKGSVTYGDLRIIFPELNKNELTKLASRDIDYMNKFPHIKIQRIN